MVFYVLQENNVLFGRKIEPELEEIPNTKRINGDHRVSLLQIHKKMSTRAAVQQKDGFVPISVETGIIGKGPKRKKKCPISLVITNFYFLAHFKCFY